MEEIKDQINAYTHTRYHHICHFSCNGVHKQELIMADFNIGAKIKHKILGEGDATAINGVGDSTKLTITFYDTKVIMASFV